MQILASAEKVIEAAKENGTKKEGANLISNVEDFYKRMHDKSKLHNIQPSRDYSLFNKLVSEKDKILLSDQEFEEIERSRK